MSANSDPFNMFWTTMVPKMKGTGTRTMNATGSMPITPTPAYEDGAAEHENRESPDDAEHGLPHDAR